jgi:iron complex transport system ATP-binding protein
VNAIPSPAVVLTGVGVTLGGNRVLEHVDWELPRGSRAALLGANGSGKSTLLRLLAGYQYPTEGTAHILGERFGAVDLSTLRQRIGVVDPASPLLFDERTSVRDAVLTGFFGNLAPWFNEPTPMQEALADETLETVGLSNHAQQPFTTLSTGERRRTLLARVLVQQPELLLLDEPAAGLDLPGREELLATLEAAIERRPDLTLIVATHWLEELPASTDHVLLLSEGRAAASGLPTEVLTQKRLSAAFRTSVTVRHDDGRWHWFVDRKRTWGK